MPVAWRGYLEQGSRWNFKEYLPAVWNRPVCDRFRPHCTTSRRHLSLCWILLTVPWILLTVPVRLRHGPYCPIKTLLNVAERRMGPARYSPATPAIKEMHKVKSCCLIKVHRRLQRMRKVQYHKLSQLAHAVFVRRGLLTVTMSIKRRCLDYRLLKKGIYHKR